MSGLLNNDDLTGLQATLAAMRSDHEESITIRRGATTLDAQLVRIARAGGSGQNRDSEGGEEYRGSVIVLGPPSLDIQPGDRFNDSNGVLYRVSLVRPNRMVSTAAEAEMVQ